MGALDKCGNSGESANCVTQEMYLNRDDASKNRDKLRTLRRLAPLLAVVTIGARPSSYEWALLPAANSIPNHATYIEAVMVFCLPLSLWIRKSV